ncbi:hypothetical protein [Myroides odoratus]|uniref:hypothetical protein n=1 Tax=Myroides odoratus TaxID=256 RepID=UPI00333E5606
MAKHIIEENIKTIGGQSIIGKGDLSLTGIEVKVDDKTIAKNKQGELQLGVLNEELITELDLEDHPLRMVYNGGETHTTFSPGAIVLMDNGSALGITSSSLFMDDESGGGRLGPNLVSLNDGEGRVSFTTDTIELSDGTSLKYPKKTGENTLVVSVNDIQADESGNIEIEVPRINQDNLGVGLTYNESKDTIQLGEIEEIDTQSPLGILQVNKIKDTEVFILGDFDILNPYAKKNASVTVTNLGEGNNSVTMNSVGDSSVTTATLTSVRTLFQSLNLKEGVPINQGSFIEITGADDPNIKLSSLLVTDDNGVKQSSIILQDGNIYFTSSPVETGNGMFYDGGYLMTTNSDKPHGRLPQFERYVKNLVYGFKNVFKCDVQNIGSILDVPNNRASENLKGTKFYYQENPTVLLYEIIEDLNPLSSYTMPVPDPLRGQNFYIVFPWEINPNE